MSDSIEVEESSGNVFADLDLPDAEERYAKALEERGLTQAQIAELLGTTPPKTSD